VAAGLGPAALFSVPIPKVADCVQPFPFEKVLRAVLLLKSGSKAARLSRVSRMKERRVHPPLFTLKSRASHCAKYSNSAAMRKKQSETELAR
jgi:hypothetical protein